ncbi:hypothetical protein JW916_04030 [Candidatus Sumerlaeota bacterium]|nr:hypothetical protein [Candidatus Sumerlaeota bacterium]
MPQSPEPPAPSRPSGVVSGFVIGISEDPFLGDGWHEREVHGLVGLPFRPTKRTAAFRLPLAPGASRLKLLLFAHVALLGKAYEGRLLLDGRSLGEIRLETESWALRTFDLPPTTAPREGQFVLDNRSLLIPALAIPGNRDPRELGCCVGAVVVE